MKNSLYTSCLLWFFLIIQIKPATAQGIAQSLLTPDDTTDATFFDGFARGLLGHWEGKITSFHSTDGRLLLTETASSPAYLSTSSTRIRNTVWEFGLQVTESFSASNYVRLYLISTDATLSESQQTYYLQIDGSTDDHVYRLWKQNGSTRSMIFQSNRIPNQAAQFSARIRVVNDQRGYWQILTDEYQADTFTVLASQNGQTSIPDNPDVSGKYTGYYVNFSPTRWRDFQLHYLLIKPFDQSTDPGNANPIQPNDLLINEILSNPKSEGVDFVELYNNSEKAVDLQHVTIASVTTNGNTNNPRTIATRPTVIEPGHYALLTSNPGIVSQHYPQSSDPNTFVEMTALPNFNNETGGVVLYSAGVVIDSLFYTPAMQSPFITSHRGISLERQHFSMPANASGNFQSAATTVGGATPGQPNSQKVADPLKAEVYLGAKTFSPDGDGFEDQLEIHYHFPLGGFMANVDIFTDNGQLVRKLLRNQSLAVQGVLTWDGFSDSNTRLPVGIYIAVIEVYNAQGTRNVHRKSFVLARRL